MTGSTSLDINGRKKSVEQTSDHSEREFLRTSTNLKENAMIDPRATPRILILFSLILLCHSKAFAQDLAEKAAELPSAPLTYKMQLIYIFEAGHTDYIFTIGQSGFRSVEALKKFIADLPKGSTIEFQSTCRRTGGEPLISSKKELADFKKICEDHSVTFRYIPAG